MKRIEVILISLVSLAGCSNAEFSSRAFNNTAMSGDSTSEDLRGIDGVRCWEGITNDANGDGLLNAEDCQGAEGPIGLTGLRGDAGLNGSNGSDGRNGANGRNCFDSTGDSDGNGSVNSADCRGPQGASGINGVNGMNGRPGQDCFANLSDRNGDGLVDARDCLGLPGAIQFNGFETIGCAIGRLPGGVDPQNLMNVNSISSFSTATCPPGKRLVAAGLLGSYQTEGTVPLQPFFGRALIEHGVAIGKAEPTDLHTNKIQCFIGDRNPHECPNPPCAEQLFDMGVAAWGLCAPIADGSASQD